MKGVCKMLLLALMFLIGLPLVIGFSAISGDESYTISVWNEETGKVEKVDFEEYVTCVVASEMPSTFETEALKAQAVACRTYAMAKVKKYEEVSGTAHPKAPLCNTVHCQVYKSEKELIELHGEGWKDTGFEKIKAACNKTKGQLLYYDGEIISQPLFFSSSGGQTENSEDVFSDEYPYLVSVASPYEDGATHTNEVKSFTFGEIKNKLNGCYSDRDTGDINASNIKILTRTAGGRVDKIQIGKSTYRGVEVRSALGLSSALFSIEYETNVMPAKVNFISNGYGHGVGMSQYGANGMAKQGKNYIDILTHYYTGTEVY